MSKATAAGFEVEFFTTALTPEQQAEADRQITPDVIEKLLAVEDCHVALSTVSFPQSSCSTSFKPASSKNLA
jgi:hypothetical protein